MILLKIIFFFVTAYYAFCALYVILYAIAGVFYRKPTFAKAQYFRKIAVLVPAYKADSVIEELADNVLQQEYPDFDLIIIADSLKEEVLQQLRQKPVKLMEFAAPNRTKALALNTAMAQLPDDYEIALILDADNIIPDKHYLSRLNDVFEAGIQAVQTHRTAKNSNTALATLDAVSEEINNSLFRRGHVALGLSSALIGSAMAFDYRLYKAQMAQVSSSGEDKELEMLLLRNRIPVTYVENLLVLDEKVQQSGTFVNQRARWIANQVMQARKNFAEGWKQLFRGNLDFFDKSIQLLLLPRVLLLASVTLLCLAALVFLPWHYASVWLEIAGITYCGILAAIPKRMYNIALLKAVFYLPVAILLMLLSLLRMKDATKKFVATEHVATSEMITNQKNK